MSATLNHASVPSPRQPAPQHRRRGRTLARTDRSEETIGFVLVDKKKFKCSNSNPDCKELTFGRLADLRRHFEQNHSTGGEEYYCHYSGCSRSHAPTGGRGRSFGSRKDKRDEHERNVHHKKDSPKSSNREYSFSPEDSL
jgi:hypothetical protein